MRALSSSFTRLMAFQERASESEGHREGGVLDFENIYSLDVGRKKHFQRRDTTTWLSWELLVVGAVSLGIFVLVVFIIII